MNQLLFVDDTRQSKVMKFIRMVDVRRMNEGWRNRYRGEVGKLWGGMKA